MIDAMIGIIFVAVLLIFVGTPGPIRASLSAWSALIPSYLEQRTPWAKKDTRPWYVSRL